MRDEVKVGKDICGGRTASCVGACRTHSLALAVLEATCHGAVGVVDDGDEGFLSQSHSSWSTHPCEAPAHA